VDARLAVTRSWPAHRTMCKNNTGGTALQRAAITMVAWGRLLPTESETMRLVR
jgi:hypothetical protein